MQDTLRVSSPEELKKHYMSRLKRLLRLRKDHKEDLSNAGLWLLDSLTFVTFCDLRDLGCEAEAKSALKRLPAPEEFYA